jgi:hypothetical protein
MAYRGAVGVRFKEGGGISACGSGRRFPAGIAEPLLLCAEAGKTVLASGPGLAAEEGACGERA